MDENNMTERERKFNQQLKKMYDEDVAEIPTPDTSFIKVDSAKKKSRKKFLFIGKIAAVIALMAISSIATAICITEGYAEAFKDSIEKKIFTWKHGVTVTNDSTFVDEQSEVWTFSDLSLIQELPDIFPEIKIPEYVPDKYIFESAIVEHSVDNDYIATFNYSNGTDSLRIMQMPIFEDTAAGGASSGEAVQLSDRIITIWNDFVSDVYGCTVVFDDVNVQISTSELSNEEVLKIAKKMQ